MVLASPGLPDIPLLIFFEVGALVMRSAGCIVNDLADREFDKKVARTRTRPLASGELSVRDAVLLLAVLLAIGLWILLQLPVYAVWVGMGSLPLVFTYPFMKRITYWPQLVLGLTFNWGMLVAFASVRGEIPFSAVLAYIACVFWTLGYDTIYACQDMADDVQAGVKSTALRFGTYVKRWVSAFYMLFVGLIGIAAWMEGCRFLFYAALGFVAGHLIWQVRTLDPSVPSSAGVRFRSNIRLGAVMFAGLLFDRTWML